jgi:serine/threonine-protein kinase
MLEAAAEEEKLVQQFVREAIITARLQHPHIIPIHDLGFLERKQLYYTMSYIEGETFRSLMHTIDLPERVRVLRCAALALSHAHSKGLWHRDVKPQNILIGGLGDTYVIDWGLVSVESGKEYKLNLPKVVLDRVQYAIPDNLIRETEDAITATNDRILGTPAYMAPEQIKRGEEMGPVSDIWALGVILFECLTGRHPVVEKESNNAGEIMEKVLYHDFPVPSDIDHTVPRNLNDLCRKMLNKDHRIRLQSLQEVIEVFTSYLRSHPHPNTFFALRPVNDQSTESGVSESTALASETCKRHNIIGKHSEREIERLLTKNEILTELVQLHWYQFARRKELWTRLLHL